MLAPPAGRESQNTDSRTFQDSRISTATQALASVVMIGFILVFFKAILVPLTYAILLHYSLIPLVDLLTRPMRCCGPCKDRAGRGGGAVHSAVADEAEAEAEALCHDEGHDQGHQDEEAGRPFGGECARVSRNVNNGGHGRWDGALEAGAPGTCSMPVWLAVPLALLLVAGAVGLLFLLVVEQVHGVSDRWPIYQV